MAYLKRIITYFFLPLAMPVMVGVSSCGQAVADQNENINSHTTAQEPFKKLTSEQIVDPCQWMPDDLIKRVFLFENGMVGPPRKATGFTNICDKVVKENGSGVALSWQLSPFDDQEVYETSVEAASILAQQQKLKSLKLGAIASINHQNAGGGLIVSILQVHGSSYALNLTSQYKGTMAQEQIEEALVEIAKVILNKHP